MNTDIKTERTAMNPILASLGWWTLWQLTFIGFPIGGAIAYFLLKSVDGPLKGLLAGAIAGLFIGTAQWLVLRRRSHIKVWWIVATSLGLAFGLAASITVMGTGTEAFPVLLRGAIAGIVLGFAQWLVLREASPKALWWVFVMTCSWALGWTVSRAAGVDLSYSWAVFGALGALAFTIVTGGVLLVLVPPERRALRTR